MTADGYKNGSHERVTEHVITSTECRQTVDELSVEFLPTHAALGGAGGGGGGGGGGGAALAVYISSPVLVSCVQIPSFAAGEEQFTITIPQPTSPLCRVGGGQSASYW